jgi:hypothetical protein
MPFIANVVGQASQQISYSLKGTVNSAEQGVKLAVANAQNTLANTASQVVNNTVKSAVGAAVNATSALLSGNVSGAISSLNPSNILSSALGGLSSSSAQGATLSAPGTFSAFSSSGGVTPGDALLGAQARSDPMMNFMWWCQLPVINPISGNAAQGVSTSSLAATLTAGVTSFLSSALGGSVSTSASAQLPWYFVEGATLPFRQFEERAVFREGRSRKYPYKYNVNNLTLDFYMGSDNLTFQYLQAWNNTLVAPFSPSSATTLAGGFGRPSDYKKPIYVYLLDVTKNVMAIVEYTECFPTMVGDYAMTSDNAARVVSQVHFSVGDVFINLLDVSPDLTQLIVNNPLSNALTSGISSVASTIESTASSAISSVFNAF